MGSSTALLQAAGLQQPAANWRPVDLQSISWEQRNHSLYLVLGLCGHEGGPNLMQCQVLHLAACGRTWRCARSSRSWRWCGGGPSLSGTRLTSSLGTSLMVSSPVHRDAARISLQQSQLGQRVRAGCMPASCVPCSLYHATWMLYVDSSWVQVQCISMG